ncbi:fatty acid CoA ligase family protein [Geminisphaera colitermitum]|uniref:fatty acid CoA ligase family protein n=1 Tax=Geminisphaera colitermitum TaxID=1148786 RepID=UPI000309CE2F|nr:fatty acid CoA ligase family protein [Geminisphaera colitermitum]
MFDSPNIARHLDLMAASQPAHPALKIPRGRTRDGRIDYLTLTFAELHAEVSAWCRRLESRGVVRGDRVLVMVRQGLPLIAAAFALFRLGAVPVIIDPGMGRKNFLAAVAHSRPRVLLGIPAARIASHIFRRAFGSVEIRVPASSRATARLSGKSQISNPKPQILSPPPPAAEPIPTLDVGRSTLDVGRSREARPPPPPPSAFPCAQVAANETAAILFTSGSTGAPKGVVYTHGQFAAQVELVRSTYDIQPGEVDLPLLPVFALFNPALGTTTIVPEIDPSRPGAFDPARAVQAILQENVTYSFGSPTLWGKIARHCHATHTTLPGLRRVLCAGAPVPPWLWQALPPLLPDGTLHSPYGATEALPISSIEAGEVNNDTAAATLAGAGTCVGRVLPANQVKIIALTNAPLASLNANGLCELPPCTIGEIIVRGPTVTREYDRLPDATAHAKIPDADALWHRMGDCGYLDEQGRLWFCGRKAERVETIDGPLFTEQIEPVFNAHPKVRRTALIGLGPAGRQRPAIIVEPASTASDVLKDSAAARTLARELRALSLACPRPIPVKIFYFHPGFPVDVRHNAKIHRLTLTTWAQSGAIGYETDPKR